jgi:hypothetical protein
MSGKAKESNPPKPATSQGVRLSCALEILILLGAMFWMHGTPAPEVNEPHYLAKAKHFWNPDWCEQDMFLASPDVHYLFEYAFGWLTLYFPLSVVAWIGRILAWSTLAASWCYLTRSIVPRFGATAVSGLLLLLGVKHFHLAGEWLVGGIEAKCFSFPLVFLGIGLFLHNRWRSANLALGAATAMHVLTGGWAYLAMFFAAVAARTVPTSSKFFQGAAIAALVGALGIAPALYGTRSGSPKEASTAYSIYVYQRLPHHLVLGDMAIERKERFGLLTASWLILVPLSLLLVSRIKADGGQREESLTRFSRFQTIVAITLLFALLGAALDQYARIRPTEAAHLLRFYWFRASDIFVPAGVAISAVTIASFAFSSNSLARVALIAILLGAGYFAYLDGMAEHRFKVPRADAAVIPHNDDPENSRSATHANWVRVCEWTEKNTPKDAIIWSARRQQSFKWYAERAEVHNYKDIPQDPKGLLEWRDRLEVVREMARKGGIWMLPKTKLLELQKKYRFTYVILYKSGVHKPLPFERVYPTLEQENRHYEVYRLPPIDKAAL